MGRDPGQKKKEKKSGIDPLTLQATGYEGVELQKNKLEHTVRRVDVLQKEERNTSQGLTLPNTIYF